MTSTSWWQQTSIWLGGTVSAVAISPAFLSDHLALAATPAGIYRSTDGGKSWAWSATGITDPIGLAVAFALTKQPEQPKAFVSTQGGRLFVSDDGAGQWAELMGWSGLGVITSLAISPQFASDQTLFVTTDEGVFRSQDGGRSWESSTFGLHDTQTLCLVCAPDFCSNPQPSSATHLSFSEILWVGTAAGGFYRSRNAGRSWRDAGDGLPDDAIAALLVSPAFANDATLYLGTETKGLYRSTDGGATWQLLHAELAAYGITCLAAIDAQHLLLGTGAGIYWSADGGQSWQAGIAGDVLATSLAVAADGTVLAATLADGIYRSTDGGKSWQAATVGLAAHVPPVVLSADPAIFMLDSNGQLLGAQADQPWAHLNPTERPGVLLAAASTMVDGAPTLFAAAASGGLYRATWQGGVFQWLPGPESTQTFPLMVAAPAGVSTEIRLSDQAGALYAWDGDATLKCINATPPWAGAALLTLAFAQQYATAQTLVAVTVQPEASGHYGLQLWQSNDGGLGWENLAGLVSELPAVALAWPVDPHEAALFVATRHRVIKLFTEPDSHELRSTQRFLANTLNITALAASPAYATDQTLWAATTQGVYQSSDGGDTWANLGAGLEARSVVALVPPTATHPLRAVTLGGAVWALAED